MRPNQEFYHLLNNINIGSYFQGGTVVYIFQPGDSCYVAGETHGLICSENDIGTAIWGPDTLVAGTSKDLCTGQSNTNAIIAAIGSSTSYAAGLCDAYTNDGYSDWYLPSYWELAKFWMVYRSVTPNYGFGGHWSSSDYNTSSAWKISGPSTYTPDGSCCWALKSAYGPQPIRAFRTF